MNKELWLVILPGLSWILGSLGGTEISPTIKGQKWIPRFLLPSCYGLSLFAASFMWWQYLLVTSLAIGVFCLGYGSSKSWQMRCLVALAFGCISLPIGFSFWNIATTVTFISVFMLSNWASTAKSWTWKICEGFIFCMVGIQIAYLMM